MAAPGSVGCSLEVYPLDMEVVSGHPGDSHRLRYLDILHKHPSASSGSTPCWLICQEEEEEACSDRTHAGVRSQVREGHSPSAVPQGEFPVFPAYGFLWLNRKMTWPKRRKMLKGELFLWDTLLPTLTGS